MRSFVGALFLGLLGAPALAQQLDADADGVADAVDNCPDAWNPDQHDDDGDGTGEACDTCP